MKVKAKINYRNVSKVKKLMTDALLETADALKTDLQKSQTMPFDTGALQNRSFFIDESKKARGVITIGNDTPYARRIYHHPEYNFRTDKNPNAGGKWFEPYISGNKKAFTNKTFARLLKKKMR